MVVRAILTNFSKIRLAVGIKEKDSTISYYISTLSSDPLYLLGGIVLMQSRDLKNIILNLANISKDNYDYGEEENSDDKDEEEQQEEQDDDENIPPGISLGANFNFNFSAPDLPHPTLPQKDGGGKSKSRAPLKAINKSNSISMGDDMWEELREVRTAWLDEWDRNRQGPTYLCAKNLEKWIC